MFPQMNAIIRTSTTHTVYECQKPFCHRKFHIGTDELLQNELEHVLYAKLTLPLYRPWGLQEVEAPRFQDNRHIKVVRLWALRTGRLYLHSRYPWYHFCYRLSRPHGQSAAGRIMSMKNSNDTIENRTGHLPACSAVPQPTAPRVGGGGARGPAPAPPPPPILAHNYQPTYTFYGFCISKCVHIDNKRTLILSDAERFPFKHWALSRCWILIRNDMKVPSVRPLISIIIVYIINVLYFCLQLAFFTAVGNSAQNTARCRIDELIFLDFPKCLATIINYISYKMNINCWL
jgi:hypothetical protein